MKWFKIMCTSSKQRMPDTSILTDVYVAYSPIDFMYHKWTMQTHDGYPPINVLLPVEYIPPSIPILCNSKYTRGAHDSSFFLFLVNIDYDAKPKDFFTQELWGGLPQRTSSTPLIGLNHVKEKLVHHLEPQKGPNRLDHQLDQQWDPTKSLDYLQPSSVPDLCQSPCLSLTITVLLAGHSYYLLMKMGRYLTSTSLMAYLKYSFEIED